MDLAGKVSFSARLYLIAISEKRFVRVYEGRQIFKEFAQHKAAGKQERCGKKWNTAAGRLGERKSCQARKRKFFVIEFTKRK